MQCPPNGSFVLLTTKEEIIEINIQLFKSAQEASALSFNYGIIQRTAEQLHIYNR